jgi:hypothetical protein
MTPPEKKHLAHLLAELSATIEELLLAGLTAASKSSLERLDVAFKEAARMKLLRLGNNLRIANEEISRFTSGSAQFSARRLAFFLSRTWLLASAMGKALARDDDAQLASLLATPPVQPVERVRAVTLGIVKRVLPGAATFDFRLRALDGSGPVEKNEPLVWSAVFPMRSGLDLPVEAFLHLPQKQKFKPAILVEKKIVELTKCAVSRQPTSATRLLLSDASTVTTTTPFAEWESFWSTPLPAAFQQAAARLDAYKPTPLDLEIELQEELFLPDTWHAGEKATGPDESADLLPISTSDPEKGTHSPPLTFETRLDRGPSGIPLSGTLPKLAKQKKKPPLYALAHYESCRLLLHPLTALERDGPNYLTLSQDKISQAELVKAMKFT